MNETVQCRFQLACPVSRTTEASSACENVRPIAAPICATSLAGPSRSSRAISDACKLAGTVASPETEPPLQPPGSRPRSPPQEPPSSFLPRTEERRRCAPRSLPTHPPLVPSFPPDPAMTATTSRCPKPVERQARHMRLSHPWRVELRAESYDEQCRESFDSIHGQAEYLETRRIDPVHILEDH